MRIADRTELIVQWNWGSEVHQLLTGIKPKACAGDRQHSVGAVQANKSQQILKVEIKEAGNTNEINATDIRTGTWKRKGKAL